MYHHLTRTESFILFSFNLCSLSIRRNHSSPGPAAFHFTSLCAGFTTKHCNVMLGASHLPLPFALWNCSCKFPSSSWCFTTKYCNVLWDALLLWISGCLWKYIVQALALTEVCDRRCFIFCAPFEYQVGSWLFNWCPQSNSALMLSPMVRTHQRGCFTNATEWSLSMCLFLPTCTAGTFKLKIEFSEEYPNKPPSVKFVSKMFHPNGEMGHDGGADWPLIVGTMC